MTQLSNLPPGCTNADIERACGGDEEIESTRDELAKDALHHLLFLMRVKGSWTELKCAAENLETALIERVIYEDERAVG